MKNLINPVNYIKSPEDSESIKILMEFINKNVKPDGVRNRAYLKLIWNRLLNEIKLAENQNYFQSAGSNIVDGGKIRKFAIMDENILNLSIMQNVIQHNLNFINKFSPLDNHQELVLGLHFIQYKVNKYGASYSSPDFLHRDDEPLVFVHLLNLTPNTWGGDNLFANLETKEITNVIRLEKPFETIVLTRDYYHAVTPLGAREGEAIRDILLFTVEPREIQVESAA
jgi:hypothetical protein